MRKVILAAMLSLMPMGCATTSDVVAVPEDICSFVLHWDPIMNVCWGEAWQIYSSDRYLRVLPLDCAIVRQCLSRISTEDYQDGIVK